MLSTENCGFDFQPRHHKTMKLLFTASLLSRVQKIVGMIFSHVLTKTIKLVFTASLLSV